MTGVQTCALPISLVSDEDGNSVPDGQDDWDGDGTANASDATPGSIPAPPAPPGGGGGGGGSGGCGLTGLEALAILLLGRRIRRTL